MTETRVSERMEALLLEVVLDARSHERNGDRHTLADYEESRTALLSAIAEIEQRAEAVYDCGTSSCLCGGLLEPLHGGQHTNGPCQCTPRQLRQAVVLARQRAEKWRELALALWAQAEACRNGYDECRERDDRSDAAIAALGNEWDEAVK